MITIKRDAENMLRLIGLVDRSGAPGSTPVPVTGATLTGEIIEGDGDVIVTGLSLLVIGASNDYEVLLTRVNSLLLVLEKDYDFQVEADDGVDRTRLFSDSLRAVEG